MFFKEKQKSLQLAEDISQRIMKNQIRKAIVGRGIPVDQHQAVAAVVADEARRRVHRQAGAGHDQKISIGDGCHAFFDCVLVQGFFIPTTRTRTIG